MSLKEVGTLLVFAKGGFFSESAFRFSNLPISKKKNSRPKHNTVMGGNSKFQVQDSFLEYLFWGRLGDLRNESHFLKKDTFRWNWILNQLWAKKKLLMKVCSWQLVENSEPPIIVQRQCDIRIPKSLLSLFSLGFISNSKKFLDPVLKNFQGIRGEMSFSTRILLLPKL